MTDLLDRAVAAHGGLDRFNHFKTVSAYLVTGGALQSLKGQAGVLSKVRLTVDLHQEHASLAPFKLPNQRAVFTPERVAIETNEGAIVAERANPSLVVEAGEQEGVYLASFDLDAIREYRARESCGNAFRKPHRYGLLIEQRVEDPFVRVNIHGVRYQSSKR